jgi:hypothetical protein
MNKIYLFLLLSLLTSGLFSQNNGWGPSSFPQLKGKVSKTDANIRYTVDSTMSIDQRNDVINKTKEYITENLALINESDFNEPIHIILVRELNDFGGRIWGIVVPEDERMPTAMIISIYGPKRSSLRYDLMRLIIPIKWGEQHDPALKWLSVGISAYANSEAFDYDGHSFEERYTCFLQNRELLQADTLAMFTIEEFMPGNKIAYSQAAYIVKYLIDNYGIEKLKQLWQEGMDSFEKIYGRSFNQLINAIDKELNKKYPEPINFNWKVFNSDCFASQYEQWLVPVELSANKTYKNLITKVDGNIKYAIDPTFNFSERKDILLLTEKYIVDNLTLINESEFDEFVYITLVENRSQVEEITGQKIGGMAFSTNKHNSEDGPNVLISVYNNNNPLKHELMHVISFAKWGEPKGRFLWLGEGLAVYANPETEECTGYTLEERYTYLLQNNRILNIDELTAFPGTRTSYSQAGYIVKHLIEKLGIEKFKLLWQNGIDNFEKIYGLSFEEILLNINTELNEKYPEPINLDWETFNTDCVESLD